MKKIVLSIPEPCHEDWAHMSACDRGRFCGSCKKTVIDFTGMTDSAIARIVSKSSGEMCGRFYTDQLDRELTVPRQANAWGRYVFAMAVPALLLTLKAGAQRASHKQVKVKVVSRPKPVLLKEDMQLQTIGMVAPVERVQQPSVFQIEGNVRDANGPIPNASIQVKGTQIGCMADTGGHFRWTHQARKGEVLVVSSVGYQTKEVPVPANGIVNVQLEPAAPLEEVTVRAEYSVVGKMAVTRCTVRMGAMVQGIKATEDSSAKALLKTEASRYSFFPNPAKPGGLITISFHNPADMPRSITLYSLSGAELLTVPISPNESALVFNLRLPNTLTPGLYMIKLKNKNPKREAALKLVVE